MNNEENNKDMNQKKESENRLGLYVIVFLSIATFIGIIVSTYIQNNS